VPVSVAMDPFEEAALAVGEVDKAGDVTLTPPLVVSCVEPCASKVCEIDIVPLAFVMFRCNFDLEKKHRPLCCAALGKRLTEVESFYVLDVSRTTSENSSFSSCAAYILSQIQRRHTQLLEG
jgi:hypothetical protein